MRTAPALKRQGDKLQAIKNRLKAGSLFSHVMLAPPEKKGGARDGIEPFDVCYVVTGFIS